MSLLCERCGFNYQLIIEVIIELQRVVSCDRDRLTCASWFIGRAHSLHSIRPDNVSLTHSPQVHRSIPSSKQVKTCSQTPSAQYHTRRLRPQAAQPSIQGPQITCLSFMPFPAGISHLALSRALERVYLSLDLL